MTQTVKDENEMTKIIMKIDGMMCGMCEAHVNEAIRGAFRVRKVTSSHTKGECTVISENDISDEELKDAVGKTGYTVLQISREPCEKKGFLGIFGK